jgi:hypothetical protein
MSKVITIKKGDEYEYFNDFEIATIMDHVRVEIEKFIKSGEAKSDCIIGGVAIKNLWLKDGEITNVWVSYNANIVNRELGLVDAGVHECLLYRGDMPDEVLDEYNKIKKII